MPRPLTKAEVERYAPLLSCPITEVIAGANGLIHRPTGKPITYPYRDERFGEVYSRFRKVELVCVTDTGEDWPVYVEVSR